MEEASNLFDNVLINIYVDPKSNYSTDSFITIKK